MNTKTFKPLGLALLILAAGCAQPEPVVTLTGTAKPPLNPDLVKFYDTAPPHAEVIGTISAVSFQGMSTRQADENALRSLKTAAAKIGANGVVISSMDDKPMEGAKATAQAVVVSQ